MPGPEVNVSTSVDRFRSLVSMTYTLLILLTTSRCRFGSTWSKIVAANCWKGWMWYWIEGTWSVKHFERAQTSDVNAETDAWIISFSISLLNTWIWALRL